MATKFPGGRILVLVTTIVGLLLVVYYLMSQHQPLRGGLLLATSGLLWWIFRPSKYHEKLAKIPGPKTVPIFGNSLQMKPGALDFTKQLEELCYEYEKTTPIFKLVFGNMALVYVCRVDAVEQILGGMKNIGKSQTYAFVEPWLQKGLLTSTGEKWHSRRKLLTPTFHFKILKDFQRVFNEQAQVLVELLGAQCDGDAFDVYPFITLCALDIICETAMGKKIHAQKMGGRSPYSNAIYGFAEVMMKRFRSPWQWNDFIYSLTKAGKKHAEYLSILHGFTQKVIDERQREMDENPEMFNTDDKDNEGEAPTKKRMAFLNVLLHMAKEANFTRNDIQEEVDTFMFEGHDTTASGMSWILYTLGCYLDAQRKAQEELDDIFGDSDRPVTMEDLPKMKYLDCVMKESHRLFSPVPGVGRYVDEEIEVDGMQIPKGCSLVILLWKINRDPKHWPDPDKFDPSRFTPDNSAGRSPYAYIPFSAGPRNCIGQKFALNEEKCVISTILRNYNIVSTQTFEETKPVRAMVLRATNGIKIKLTKRSSSRL